MSVRSIKGREIRLVAKGRDLATFREGLRVGQILRGRVVEIYSGGKVLLHLRGQNLFAETQGVTLSKGQTLTLSVQDLSQKIELKWVHSPNQYSRNPHQVSPLTLTKLLGMLNRLQELLHTNSFQFNLLIPLKKTWEKLQEKARRRPVFLPKTATSNHEKLIIGEIVTSTGGYPSVIRISKETENAKQQNQSTENLWFEWSMELEGLGPIVFAIYRDNGQIHCLCYVISEMIDIFGKHIDQLISKIEKLGYPSVKVSLKTLDESIPDLLNILDCISEENINLIA
jgi:hypothetical protein